MVWFQLGWSNNVKSYGLWVGQPFGFFFPQTNAPKTKKILQKNIQICDPESQCARPVITTLAVQGVPQSIPKFLCLCFYYMFLACHLQLIWYRRPAPRKKRPKTYGTGNQQALTDSSEDYELRNNKDIYPADGVIEGEPLTENEIQPVRVGKDVYFPSYLWRLKKMNCWQVCSCVYIVVVMVSLSVIACVVIGSGWLIIAPAVVLVVTCLTFLYRDHQEGRFNCCDNTCDHVRNKVLGEDN